MYTQVLLKEVCYKNALGHTKIPLEADIYPTVSWYYCQNYNHSNNNALLLFVGPSTTSSFLLPPLLLGGATVLSGAALEASELWTDLGLGGAEFCGGDVVLCTAGRNNKNRISKWIMTNSYAITPFWGVLFETLIFHILSFLLEIQKCSIE